MEIDIRTSDGSGSSVSPTRIFRKWVIIGAVMGALIVGVAGAIILGLVMFGGAIAGAAFGAVFGFVRALIALIIRR